MGIKREVISLEEVLRFIKWLVEHKEKVEEFMSQVQFNVSITVLSSVPTLTVTPTSGSATFTQGVQGSVVLGAVTGGVPPYAVSVDAASPNLLPPGLSASIDTNNNLIVSGTPTAAGSGPVTLDVTDSAPVTSSSAVKANISSR